MKVAVAFIYNEDKQVLITQRPLDVPHGGFWEFPGGKLEPSELPEEAIVRELQEELNIEVLHSEFLDTINHSYGDTLIEFYLFAIHRYQGTPTLQEHQLHLKWIHPQELNLEDFPEANKKFIRFC